MIYNNDDEAVSRYTCVECDIDVTALCLSVCPVPPKCATCLVLDTVADPVEREAIRRYMDPDHPPARRGPHPV